MSHLMRGKKYGLQLPGKAVVAPKVGVTRPPGKSIFGEDSSDSDNDGNGDSGTDWVKKSMQAVKEKTNNTSLKKQSKIEMAKALEEDPTVFQYDEVYDDMERKKEDMKESKKEVDRKPKYMTALLKSADERQKEFERRIERQVQKEREAEGEMYKDKESFVTSAYRKKMEEIAEQEEEQARLDRIEAALDVTKQKNMDGFYRHLYRQTMGEEKGQKPVEKTEESKEEVAAKIKEEMSKIKVEEDANPEDENLQGDGQIKKIIRKKEIRKKVEEASSSDSDSDESVNDDSEKEDNKVEDPVDKMAKRKEEMRIAKEKRERIKRRIEAGADSSDSDYDEPVDKKPKETTIVDGTNEAQTEVVEDTQNIDSKPKIDIWKKRTVGAIFEDAVARYWQRRSTKESNGA